MVLFKERDDTIKDLKEKIASLEIHLQQKDKLISDLQSRSSVSYYPINYIHIKPGQVDLQFVVIACITPNTLATASHFNSSW